MNAKCEYVSCSELATLALGDRYFCKSHQETLSERLSKSSESSIENSHHVNLTALREIMKDPEIRKSLKVSLEKRGNK